MQELEHFNPLVGSPTDWTLAAVNNLQLFGPVEIVWFVTNPEPEDFR